MRGAWCLPIAHWLIDDGIPVTYAFKWRLLPCVHVSTCPLLELFRRGHVPPFTVIAAGRPAASFPLSRLDFGIGTR